jgi:Ca2+/Na+ antiporter
MFVSTVVITFIVFNKPFTVMRRPIIRDIIFFIFSLGVVMVILLYDDQMHIWQPILLLFIYLIYVLTVVFGSSIRMGKFLCFEWETKHQRKEREKIEYQANCTSLKPKMIFTGMVKF